MNEDLKIIVPAIIALIGTLIAAYLGYRQWKKQSENTRKADYLKEKQTVYKELWEKLEDVHLKLRTEYVEKPAFKDLLLGVNSFILKKQLFLEKDDQTLVNQYLKSVYELAEAIKIHGNEETQWGFEASLPGVASSLPGLSVEVAKDAQWVFEESAPEFSVEVVKEARKITKLLKETHEIRDSLIMRFKEIISGI